MKTSRIFALWGFVLAVLAGLVLTPWTETPAIAGIQPNAVLQFGKRGGLWLPPVTSVSIVTTNLESEFRFDNNSGQTLTDYKNARNGQLGSSSGSDTNDPTWGSSNLAFTTDDYVKVSTAGNNDGSTSGTRFVVAATNTNNQDAYLIGADTGILSIDQGMRLSSGKLQVFANTNFAAYNATDASHALASGTPRLFAVRMNMGTELSGWISVSGAFSKTVTETTNTTQSSSRNHNTNYYFGISGSSQTLNPLNGTIYYALFYSRSLSDSEMEQNYQAIKALMSVRGVAI